MTDVPPSQARQLCKGCACRNKGNGARHTFHYIAFQGLRQGLIMKDKSMLASPPPPEHTEKMIVESLHVYGVSERHNWLEKRAAQLCAITTGSAVSP